jgi:hypothetical protein
LIVDAQHLSRGIVILQPHARAENAIEHFRLHAVALLILEAQLRIGQAPNSFAAVVIEPGRSHSVGSMDLAWNIWAACRTHPVHQSEFGPVLSDPLETLAPFHHLRHAILQRHWRVRRE